MGYLIYFLRQWPVRFRRLLRHLLLPVYRRGMDMPATGSFWIWLGDIPFYIADLLAIPEIIQTLQIWVKPSIRPLSEQELQCAQRVFKDAVDYRLVRIDSRARVGIHAKVIAYVTFNYINFRGSLSPEIFIHEMMHVWQFQRFGSVYLFRAMKAQFSNTVYDFGGIENLYQKMLAGRGLMDFNFEQQAEIIETYYVSLDQPDAFSTMERQVLAYFAGFLGVKSWELGDISPESWVWSLGSLESCRGRKFSVRRRVEQPLKSSSPNSGEVSEGRRG